MAEINLDIADQTISLDLGSATIVLDTGGVGPVGSQGETGADGADGVGVPTGGTTGQVLQKASATDYDVEWATPSGDMLAATYDPTNVAGDAFDMANMAEASDAKVMTAAERSKVAFLKEPVSGELGIETSGVTRAYFDSTGMGIGTESPASVLDVVYTSTTQPQFIRYNSDIPGCVINVKKSRGTEASPSATQSGDACGGFYVQAYSDLGWRSCYIWNVDQQSAWSSGAADFRVKMTMREGASGFVEQIAFDKNRAIFAKPVNMPTYTVAGLPAAGTVGAGARAFVSDANATTFHSVVAGSGSNFVPVFSDGTNWRIG